MLAVEVIVPLHQTRAWHEVLIGRLREAGFDVAVIGLPGSGWPFMMKQALGLERWLLGRNGTSLAALRPDPEAQPLARRADLRLDLTSAPAPFDVPTLTLLFDGSLQEAAAINGLTLGRLPTIEALLDGKRVGVAAPMIDTRASVALATEDMLARAITLGFSVVGAFAAGRLDRLERGPADAPPASRGPRPFALSYVTSALPRLGGEVIRRVRFRNADWRVGFRFIDGPGVAETGVLGSGWSVLPDDGSRFYADPFAFTAGGRDFIFVEDYTHSVGKAVISVIEFDAARRPGEPRPVLDEPWHLSYPQVFARDGQIWMLPEASGSHKLTLYRAEGFPDRWAPAKVLIEGPQLSDATLVDCGDRLWLLATDRDGHGSTSDTLVAFHAPSLLGPWTPYYANPVLIDRRRARPGGAVIPVEGRLLLPVQDGTLGYGGGLGLSVIEALEPGAVRVSEPRPIDPAGDWPYPKIHTLNRAGALEVIDGIAAVPKRRLVKQ